LHPAAVQVDFLKLLYDKLLELHHKYGDTPQGIAFPRPSFKVRSSSCCVTSCSQQCCTTSMHTHAAGHCLLTAILQGKKMLLLQQHCGTAASNLVMWVCTEHCFLCALLLLLLVRMVLLDDG
jgi:hypothetical protein